MTAPAARPAQLEVDCLKVLWRRPEASVSEVRATLPRPLAYTTVMTVLDRMATKGLVTRRKRGRAWVYAAAMPLEKARAQAVQQLLANLFDHDPRALIEYLAAAPRLAADRQEARPRHRVASGIDDTLL